MLDFSVLLAPTMSIQTRFMLFVVGCFFFVFVVTVFSCNFVVVIVAGSFYALQQHFKLKNAHSYFFICMPNATQRRNEKKLHSHTHTRTHAHMQPQAYKYCWLQLHVVCGRRATWRLYEGYVKEQVAKKITVQQSVYREPAKHSEGVCAYVCMAVGTTGNCQRPTYTCAASWVGARMYVCWFPQHLACTKCSSCGFFTCFLHSLPLSCVLWIICYASTNE